MGRSRAAPALDGFAVAGDLGSLTAFQPAGADASGNATVAGKSIAYADMDNYNPLGDNDTNLVVTGTIFDRNLVIAAAGPGQKAVSFENLSFTSGPSSFTFALPSASLTVITGTGGDTISIAPLDSFTGTVLRYEGGVLTGTLTAGNDTAVVAKSEVSDDEGLILSLTVNGFVQSFGSLGSGVHHIALDGLGGADTFTIDDVLLIDAVSITGGVGSDTLIGPITDTRWDITGADSGTLAGFTSFAGIENLTGRALPTTSAFRPAVRSAVGSMAAAAPTG